MVGKEMSKSTVTNVNMKLLKYKIIFCVMDVVRIIILNVLILLEITSTELLPKKMVLQVLYGA